MKTPQLAGQKKTRVLKSVNRAPPPPPPRRTPQVTIFQYFSCIYRLDMCRRNYPTDICNRGTAGNLKRITKSCPAPCLIYSLSLSLFFLSVCFRFGIYLLFGHQCFVQIKVYSRLNTSHRFLLFFYKRPPPYYTYYRYRNRFTIFSTLTGHSDRGMLSTTTTTIKKHSA